MQTLLLTIISPQRSIDLKLPAETPLAELLPALVKLCISDLSASQSTWTLIVAETHKTLDTTQSLLEAQLVDGAILVLQPQALVRVLAETMFQPENIVPTTESGGIGVRWNLSQQKHPFS